MTLNNYFLLIYIMVLMNILVTMLLVLIINTSFMAVPYLMPRLNHMEILSYQIYANMLFILFLVLPRKIGDFNL